MSAETVFIDNLFSCHVTDKCASCGSGRSRSWK